MTVQWVKHGETRRWVDTSAEGMPRMFIRCRCGETTEVFDQSFMAFWDREDQGAFQTHVSQHRPRLATAE